MKMLLIDPKVLCRRHLFNEHSALHMFLGSLKKKRKLDKFFLHNCLEPNSLYKRHEELAVEMLSRGYKHQSEMEDPLIYMNYLPLDQKNFIIDRGASLKQLLERCPNCLKRFNDFSFMLLR